MTCHALIVREANHMPIPGPDGHEHKNMPYFFYSKGRHGGVAFLASLALAYPVDYSEMIKASDFYKLLSSVRYQYWFFIPQPNGRFMVKRATKGKHGAVPVTALYL
jgi:hypothetical protein